MRDRITHEDLDLLNELGVESAPEHIDTRSAREQRIIAGYEDIERFVAEHGRLPQHGEHRDIFERMYAVRLERLRASDECRAILQPLDARGLLDAGDDASLTIKGDMSDEELLASLGISASAESDITQLVHVRSRAEIRSAEEIAQRTTCEDFDAFKPIFDEVQRQIETGERQTVKFQDNATIEQGHLFILDGQKLIVANMGELFVAEHGRPDRRLRVVYDNATESDLLLRSLQRALNKDKASRRITDPDLGPLFTIGEHAIPYETGPLFSDEEDANDSSTGTIYILRSKSDNPFIAEHRSVIHKIGVTGGDVKSRIANAKNDPTYLLADVKIVATFRLVNINRKKLEALIQQFFGNVRLDMKLQDRFGLPVQPREWFLVPLNVIEEAIERIKDGTIGQYSYDPASGKLVRV